MSDTLLPVLIFFGMPAVLAFVLVFVRRMAMLAAAKRRLREALGEVLDSHKIKIEDWPKRLMLTGSCLGRECTLDMRMVSASEKRTLTVTLNVPFRFDIFIERWSESKRHSAHYRQFRDLPTGDAELDECYLFAPLGLIDSAGLSDFTSFASQSELKKHLDHLFFSGIERLVIGDGALRVTLGPGPSVEVTDASLLKNVLNALAGIGNEMVRQTVHRGVLSNRLIDAPRCPYCREPLRSEPSLYLCRQCNTLHHDECWNENGGCSIFGCRGTRHTVLAVEGDVVEST